MVMQHNMIEKQRMLKDEEEIENIKEACKVTDECFSYILTYIKIIVQIVYKKTE